MSSDYFRVHSYRSAAGIVKLTIALRDDPPGRYDQYVTTEQELKWLSQRAQDLSTTNRRPQKWFRIKTGEYARIQGYWKQIVALVERRDLKLWRQACRSLGHRPLGTEPATTERVTDDTDWDYSFALVPQQGPAYVINDAGHALHELTEQSTYDVLRGLDERGVLRDSLASDVFDALSKEDPEPYLRRLIEHWAGDERAMDALVELTANWKKLPGHGKNLE